MNLIKKLITSLRTFPGRTKPGGLNVGPLIVVLIIPVIILLLLICIISLCSSGGDEIENGEDTSEAIQGVPAIYGADCNERKAKRVAIIARVPKSTAADKIGIPGMTLADTVCLTRSYLTQYLQ